MNKFYFLCLLLITNNLLASNTFDCPTGTKVAEKNYIIEGEKIKIKGCLNENGELHGIAITLKNTKVTNKSHWENGMQIGTSISWYTTGEIKSTQHFKNDKLHGEIKYWHKNGNLKVLGYYINGKEVGLLKVWNKCGDLVETIQY